MTFVNFVGDLFKRSQITIAHNVTSTEFIFEKSNWKEFLLYRDQSP